MAVWRIVKNRLIKFLPIIKHDVIHNTHVHISRITECQRAPPNLLEEGLCRLAVAVQWMVPLRFKNSAQAAEIIREIWPSLACQRLIIMAYNSASAHHSYTGTIRILAVCTFSHAVQLFFSEKKIHVQLASRLHTACAKLGLCHMAVQIVKFKFCQY